MVHVEADEVEELVGDVGREGGYEHQHDAGDGIADGGQVRIDRGRDLRDRDQKNHDEHELGEDERDNEGDPFGEPAFGGVPGGAGEGDRSEDDGHEQQGFADEQGEPDDGRAADGEASEEDREDGADAGCAGADRGEAHGEQRDAVAHAFHGVAAGLHDADGELVGDFEEQAGDGDDDEGSKNRFGDADRGAGERCGVAVHETGDQLQAEEDQGDEDGKTEEHVVDVNVGRVGEVDEGGRVEGRPDGFEKPGGGGTHCAGEPAEGGGDDSGCNVAHAGADIRYDRHIAHAHQLPRSDSGSDGLADVPEKIDEGDGGAADDRCATGHHHSGLATGGQVGVG